MDAEEIANDLDPLYDAAMREQRNIQAGIEYLTNSAKDFISTQYAEDVNHLSAAGYRKLEDVISRHIEQLSIEITNVFYHHSRE
jgi:hypothetical protein